jgi:hypothetical protein
MDYNDAESREIHPDQGPADLKEAGGLQILVEITDGTETLRQFTNGDGHFDFDQIRPGVWQVKFLDHNLPELHHLEEEEVLVDLEPGEQMYVTARVVPHVRPIRIIDGGTIKLATRR